MRGWLAGGEGAPETEEEGDGKLVERKERRLKGEEASWDSFSLSLFSGEGRHAVGELLALR